MNMDDYKKKNMVFKRDDLHKKEFENGKFDGYNRIYYPNKKIKYIGFFRNSKYDGHGEMFYKSGQLLYKGNFKNHLFDGYGTRYNRDGTIMHDGKFSNGFIIQDL